MSDGELHLELDSATSKVRRSPRTLGSPVGQWVGISANAGSGRGEGRRAAEGLAAALEKVGIASKIAWTPDDRASMVADSAGDDGCRCLVAVGGDGTVAALVNDRPTRPITVLPTGTENLLSHHFRIGRRPDRLARIIREGRISALDLGSAAGRRFSLMAGIGFDADVVTRHHRARVGRGGRARPTHRGAYVEPVLLSSMTYRFPPLTIQVDPIEGGTEILVGTTAFLFNLPRYALGLPFAPGAIGDDGLLDLVLFREAGPFQALHYLWLVLRGLHLRRAGVYHRRVRSVSITCPETVPLQLDGDPGGVLTPDAAFTVEVVSEGIEIIVP